MLTQRYDLHERLSDDRHNSAITDAYIFIFMMWRRRIKKNEDSRMSSLLHLYKGHTQATAFEKDRLILCGYFFLCRWVYIAYTALPLLLPFSHTPWYHY